MSKKIKITIISVVAVVLVAAIIAISCTIPLIIAKVNANKYKQWDLDNVTHGTRIHFLNTQGSDAILIESDGKYAMVDCAEDTDNPRQFHELNAQGYEQKVIEYVQKIAGDKDGKVKLEFVVGTHIHSDHIGGFDTLISHEDITVGKAYIREYDQSVIDDYEVEAWDNQEVYDQMIAACTSRGVIIDHELANVDIELGDFAVQFFNGENDTSGKKKGENENSLGILVSAFGKKAFLAGDINNYDGDEDRLKDLVGDVDIMKAGHHGYAGSSSKAFVKALDPEIVIFTNTIKGVDVSVRSNFNSVGAAMYATAENNGIVIDFSESGLQMYKNLH